MLSQNTLFRRTTASSVCLENSVVGEPLPLPLLAFLDLLPLVVLSLLLVDSEPRRGFHFTCWLISLHLSSLTFPVNKNEHTSRKDIIHTNVSIRSPLQQQYEQQTKTTTTITSTRKTFSCSTTTKAATARTESTIKNLNCGIMAIDWPKSRSWL